MTIGIGWRCPEGTGLLTDSMINYETARGWSPAPGTRKYHRLGDSAVVASGTSLEDIDAVCEAIGATASTTAAAAAALFPRLVASMAERLERSQLARDADISDGGLSPQLLVAGPSVLGRL